MADDKTPTEEVEELKQEETPAEEPTTKEESSQAPEEQEQTEPEAEEPSEPEEPEPEEPPMSRRKAKRLDKLESLVEKLKGPETVGRADIKGLDYGSALDADPETVKQLEDDRYNVAQDSYNQGLQRAKSIQFHTRLEIDAPRIEARYPILDKSSNEFNPALANSINSWYLANVGYDAKSDTVANAEVRYVEFVEGIMEMADQMAGEKNTNSARNIAKQAATTGLRPDGSTAKRLDLNKPPSQMTDEELKAVIAQAI